MYRNSASFPGNNIVPLGLASPSKSNDDSEPDLPALLDRKRRQLDEEITQFKALKDKEFEDFERSLKKQRQKRKTGHKKKKDASASVGSDSKPGALSLLGGPLKNEVHQNGNTLPSQSSDRPETPPRRTPLSKPTTSIDRSNVNGETTPPGTGSGSPSTTKHLCEQLSRSPPLQIPPYRPLKEKSSKENISLVSKEQHDSFAGVFTPAYLPLLDSKETRHSEIPEIKLQRHNSFSNSQTSSMLSPISRSHRALTAPTLPSTSLPSALRTASGTAVRKRKHVTFQLADSAVVDPSSSYEELPSPEPRAESANEMNGISELMTNGNRQDTGTDDETDEGLLPPFSSRRLSSPTIKGKAKDSTTVMDPELSPRSLGDHLDEADDGGSGVGFFELDEEIASPGFGTVRPFEVDDLADDLRENEKARSRRAERPVNGGEKYTFEYGGSVPIDIVRPSGSWVGSFGH